MLERLKARRRDAALRVAPAARSLPALRSHHRAARRRATSSTFERRRGHAGPHRPRDGRTRSAAARRTRRDGGAASRRRCAVRGARPGAPCFRDVSLSVRPRRDRRALRPGRLGPLGAARDDLRPATRPTPARSRVGRTAGRAALAARRRRAPASRSCPRSASARGCFFNLTLRHNLMLPARTVDGRRARARRARAARGASGCWTTWRIKAAGVEMSARRAERRQPAEDRRREVAGDRRRGCCCSTNRRRASTSARSSRSTKSSGAQAARGAGLPGRLERPAGSARALPTASSSCAKDGSRESSRATPRPRNRSCTWRPTS